jgi:hypothetical protein
MFIKHGGTWKGGATRPYRIWRCMKNRCEYAACEANYRHYGARGVRVCDEWQSFINFRDWATSHGYDDSLQLDRIDPNGNYEPNNCRWVTTLVNASNKRNTRFLTAFGETKPLAEWTRDPRCKVKRQALWMRLKIGWKPEEALTKPAR